MTCEKNRTKMILCKIDERASDISGVFFTAIRRAPEEPSHLIPVWWLTHIMKPYAEKLYKSQRWQDTRNAYASSVGGLCERCLQRGQIVPGEIVHHKIHINADNINDPSIALNWDNLQLLCRECHAEMHPRANMNSKRRYHVDDSGRVCPIF